MMAQTAVFLIIIFNILRLRCLCDVYTKISILGPVIGCNFQQIFFFLHQLTVDGPAENFKSTNFSCSL